MFARSPDCIGARDTTGTPKVKRANGYGSTAAMYTCAESTYGKDFVRAMNDRMLFFKVASVNTRCDTPLRYGCIK
jgi:hypothetical protein